MRRVERRLFRINDELAALREVERLAIAELGYHQHLDDDAQRDAAVTGSPLDRSDARETASDVARFERHIAAIHRKQKRLESRRARLLGRLEGQG